MRSSFLISRSLSFPQPGTKEDVHLEPVLQCAGTTEETEPFSGGVPDDPHDDERRADHPETLTHDPGRSEESVKGGEHAVVQGKEIVLQPPEEGSPGSAEPDDDQYRSEQATVLDAAPGGRKIRARLLRRTNSAGHVDRT
jgi:hypothetical protein